MSLLYLSAINTYHQKIQPERNDVNIKQKQFVEKYGMIGMCMNPYKPFDIELVDSSISSPWCNICDRPLEYCRCEQNNRKL